ncbi:MAG TPA: type II toxin-antitoxin system mRNA interferase toxin, RelE/StbE family [Candidatus Dormibacteraeota bacterium]|nr:type II toxin-antitoxin system mRNA interferase toxin, RelE/StbE family [Candidatus Dormibacteraeota bacterium]
MKPIKRDKTFEKHFKQRINPNDKLVKLFGQRLESFISGELGYPLYDHALTGKLKSKRAFSVAGDIRVVYIELEDYIVFLDVGSHNQVYR